MKLQDRNMLGVVVAVLSLMATGTVRAGSLDPTNAPGPTMHTLEEIYQHLLAATQQMAVLEQRVTGIQAQLFSASMKQTSCNMALIPSGCFLMGACTNVGLEYDVDGLGGEETIVELPLWIPGKAIQPDLKRAVPASEFCYRNIPAVCVSILQAELVADAQW